jgi:hypothetical protein
MNELRSEKGKGLSLPAVIMIYYFVYTEIRDDLKSKLPNLDTSPIDRLYGRGGTV